MHYAHEEDRSVRLEYADFISSKDWDFYSTITFGVSRHDRIYWPEKLYRTFEKFDATRAVIACEPFKLGGIHFHCLSKHDPLPQSTRPFFEYCLKAFGRSRISPVKETLAVSRYCSKYVVKGGDVNFMGEAEAWNSPKYDPYWYRFNRMFTEVATPPSPDWKPHGKVPRDRYEDRNGPVRIIKPPKGIDISMIV